MSIAVIIPAYRPNRSVIDVVRRLQRDMSPSSPIVVVDDGSGSDYAPIFEELASLSVTVLRNAVNLGKGGALKNGINHALATHPELIGVVTADADGQHLAEDIRAVAAALKNSPDRLFLGVRSFRADVPFRSKFGNQMTRAVLYLFNGLSLRDTQTGLRGLVREAAARCLRIPSNGYEFELEMILREHSAGTRIVEIPITTVYEPGNPTSHFSPVFDSARIYFVFVRFLGLSLTVSALDFVIYAVAFAALGEVAPSMLIARSIAAVIFFVAAKRVVFKARGSVVRQAALFALLVAGILAMTIPFISMLVDSGFNPIGAKAIAEATLFVANFAIQRLIVFRKAER